MTETEARGLLSMVRDVQLGCRTAGLSEYSSQVVSETVGRAFQKRRYMVIEQDLKHIQEVRPPEGVEIVPLGGDWSEVLQILTRRGIARFRQRLAAGRTCLFARRDGRALGYTWISTRVETGIEFLPLALPGNAAYLWDLFVIHGARGLGVGSALTSARLAFARDAGFELGWRAISPDNRPSVRTAEKTGSVRVLGEITYVRRLGHVEFREKRDAGQPLIHESDDR